MVCKQFLANHHTNHSYIHVFDYDAFNLAKKEPNDMNEKHSLNMEKHHVKKRKKESAWQKLVKQDLELTEFELKMVKQAQALERKRNVRQYIT
jgi:hypothetical protein